MSFFDIYTKAKKTETPSLTFNEERVLAEKKAVEFSEKRKVQASLYPSATVSNETHPGHKAEATDKDRVIHQASKVLHDQITALVGKGGFEITLDEFRSVKAHKDVKDDVTISDEAVVAFKVDFETGIASDKIRTATMIVTHNANSDKQLVVEGVFYDTAKVEHKLNSQTLKNFLEKSEKSVTMANKETPLAWFNASADIGTYEMVESPSATQKVVARLKASGFDMFERWVDACYGPQTFGRICTVVDVPLDRVDEFKKIAALTDDEWMKRTDEQSFKGLPDLGKDENWVNRTDEKTGYEKPDLKKDDKWVHRTDEKGPKGNPYNTDAKLQSASKTEDAVLDQARKDAVKKSIASKQNDLGTMIASLENLVK